MYLRIGRFHGVGANISVPREPPSGKSYTFVYMRIHVCAVPTLQMPLSVWPPSRPRMTAHCCLYPLFRSKSEKLRLKSFLLVTWG